MAEEKDIGEELLSLCENCSVRRSIILNLAKTPEYVNAIRSFGGVINNESLCYIVMKSYFKILSENIIAPNATSGVKGVSKDVTGDAFFWERFLPEDLKKAVEQRRFQLRFELPSQNLYRVFRVPEVLETFAKYEVRDDLTAYDASKLALFNAKTRESDSETLGSRNEIYRIREIVEDYAKALGKDPNEWRQDYREFLETKTFTIRKAARNGGYEKITVTAEDVAHMKKHDRQLEDVDEDL